jgi:hypothetical protein
MCVVISAVLEIERTPCSLFRKSELVKDLNGGTPVHTFSVENVKIEVMKTVREKQSRGFSPEPAPVIGRV